MSRRALVARLALAGVVAVVLAALAPGVALALDVHHVLPQPGSTVAAPDHLELMVDEELRPGAVQVGISPDATNEPVTLTPLLVDGNVAVQPLPALADGAYTAGFRVLAADGHVYQTTFGFTVRAGAPPAAPPAAPAPPDRSALVTAVAAGLTLPAAGALVLRLRRRAGARR